MLFSSLVKSAILANGLVLAAPAHVHNLHKRDVVVVTETVVVTAGQEAATTAAAATTSTAAAAVAAGTTVSTSTSTSTAASTAASSTATSGSGSFAYTGITYSPYTSSGGCKSLSEVQSDLAELTDYEIIRLYGVDCSQVEFVLQAKLAAQKLFLGIYYVDAIEAGISEIAAAIESYGSWDDVYTVSIGNELVNGGSATVDQVASYVSTGRSALTSAGYTGPVVSVDTHVAVLANTGLCEISDYIAINAHAYFDYNTAAADAGTWLLTQIERVYSACGSSKNVLVTESGWPHQGDTYGQAIASPEAQAAAIASLKETCHDSVILFTAFDDLWKADGYLNCEKYWGFI